MLYQYIYTFTDWKTKIAISRESTVQRMQIIKGEHRSKNANLIKGEHHSNNANLTIKGEPCSKNAYYPQHFLTNFWREWLKSKYQNYQETWQKTHSFTHILSEPKMISLCHQYIVRPVCISVQSDQALYCWLTNFRFSPWYP